MKRANLTATLAAGALAGIALFAVIGFGGSNNRGVNADTPTPTPTPTPTATATATPTPTPTPTPSPTPTPFSFSVACTPNPATTAMLVTCIATPAPSASASGVTYLWDFGDGSSPGIGPSATHTYATANTYTVTATATLPSGMTLMAQTTERVTGAFGLTLTGPTTGAVGAPLTYTATAASGTVLPADTTYTWTITDGTSAGPSTPNSLTHSFATSGTYTVSVTATSASAGTSGSASMTVTIGGTSQALTLSIAGPTQVAAGTSATYSVSSIPAAPSDVVYTWTFGDGTGSQIGISVPHTWATAGTYSVTVTASSVSTPAVNGSTTSISVVVSSAQPTGPSATYGPGWNLIGGAAGAVFSQASNPLYTFQSGDSAYRSVPNTTALQGGWGYWAYFNTTTTVGIGSTTPTLPFTEPIPAGQYIMIGNPSPTQTVTVTGADVVYIYNASTGYAAVTTLQPGQGGWAYSGSGGTLTMR